MGKGIGHSYKHSQPNCPYRNPDNKSVVTPHSSLSSQHDITNNSGVTLIACNQPSPTSNLTTTTPFDTDSNNDDNTLYFSTPRKYNNSNPEIT